MPITAGLPESKRDFPKCLYLDQDKWIALSRAVNPHLTSFQQHLEFICAVPGANVLLTLGQERFRDGKRRTDRNDFKDIGFLRVALPYASLVAT